ncbi:MAG: methyltransferase [Mycobacteriales bacterium]
MVSGSTLRGAVVWEALRAALDGMGGPLVVVDAGGGTGGFAVPLAELGHVVTVVDPSPDSLAALTRRASERDVAERVRGVQGDLARLLDVVPVGQADVVVCHSVLEVVEDPAAAVRVVRAVLRPGGLVSVLAANRTAAVLARALAGRFREALHALHDPAGRDVDHAAARRFDRQELVSLVTAAGLVVETVHGVRVFTDLVAGSVLDVDPAAREELLDLERAAAVRPEFADLATQLHLLARLPA